jgi:adenine-specific DNA-methyltransferase
LPKKKDFSSYSKEELIKHIHALEKRKTYGLVWDEERTKEKFEEDAEGKFPVLKEVTSKEIKTDPDKPTHILIEGDNYHALSVLNYTHNKSVDVIYIDPPYNTGNKTWRYNNHYVEKDDAFRHSKWLSFMKKRLQIAKNILSNNGIIVIAIDDYEHHTLRLLMDDLFGEENRLGTIVVVHNPRGRNDDKYFATMHEYLLVYAKNAALATVGHFELTEEEIDQYNKADEISAFNETSFMRTGNNSNRETRPNLFYPIFYDPRIKKLSLEKMEGTVKLLPINEAGEEKTWRWGKETFAETQSTELLVRTVKDKYRIFKKRRLRNIPGRKPKTVWYDPKYDASSYGIMILQKILGRENSFPYPKSIYAVKDILSILCSKNSTVVDFFAGSGTTGHAVLELNKLDGGSRKVILCTNNENDICTDICYPRVKKVIKGYTDQKDHKTDGLGGNLKYYRTDFVGSEPTHRNKKILTDQSTEMLCIKENAFDEVLNRKAYKLYQNNSKYLAILFDEMHIEEFKKELRKLKLPVRVYAFSLEGDDFDEDFEDLENDITVCSIPEAILRVYRRIFKK